VYFYDIFKNLTMKTKDILLVGAGATIIYLLWRRSKKQKDSKEIVGGIVLTGGATTGTGAVPNPLLNIPNNGFAMPLQQGKPEQVFGLNLPPNMDLPNLTAGTGVPTEVAVQQGGIPTSPTPAMANTPILSIEDALGDGIKPIKNTGITTPVLQPIEYPISEPRPKNSTSISQDIQPASSEQYSSNIIKNEQNLGTAPATLSANGMNTRGRVINGTLFRGVM
jgi:hypothetical protein